MVTLICDGMDQCKWELPRHPVLKGKEFASLVKVKVHVACVICHGKFIMFLVSLPNTKKDASTSVEMLSAAFTKIQAMGIPLASTDVVLQHDNTCREFKNNSGLRRACAQVSSKNVKSITCQYLRSGHTHEDVDQLFGLLSKYLLRIRQMQTPSDVVETIQGFLANTKLPFAGERLVYQMDSVRDWIFGLCFPLLDGAPHKTKDPGKWRTHKTLFFVLMRFAGQG